MHTLTAHNICLAYPKGKRELSVILQNVNLHLAGGELVSLLGPSGVGKSSLLRVLAGLQKPQSGEVFLFKQKITSPHSQMHFIFQNPSLLPWLTVYENVKFGMRFKSQPKISKSALKQRVNNALAEVGLQGSEKLYPHELSGGMAQRVSLARALVRQPKIIFLDEPFSALDEVTRTQMQDLLRQLVHKHHTTAVLVTHDIDEALLVSDRVILLGNKPAKQIGQWQISRHYAANEALLQLQPLRLEILQALQSANQQQLQATIEYII